VRTNKGKASRDDEINLGFPRIQRAHLLGNALALCIGRIRIEPIRPSKVILGDMAQILRLPPVDRAGTCQEKLLCTPRLGKLKHALRAIKEGAQKLERLTGRSCGRRRRGVNDVVKLLPRKVEIANISPEHPNAALAGKVRHLPGPCFRFAAENRGGQAERKFAIAIGQALQQPGSKKPGPPRNKYAPAACLLPQRQRMPQDKIQVFCWQWLHATSITRALRGAERAGDETYGVPPSCECGIFGNHVEMNFRLRYRAAACSIRLRAGKNHARPKLKTIVR